MRLKCYFHRILSGEWLWCVIFLVLCARFAQILDKLGCISAKHLKNEFFSAVRSICTNFM